MKPSDKTRVLIRRSVVRFKGRSLARGSAVTTFETKDEDVKGKVVLDDC